MSYIFALEMFYQFLSVGSAAISSGVWLEVKHLRYILFLNFGTNTEDEYELSW